MNELMPASQVEHLCNLHSMHFKDRKSERTKLTKAKSTRKRSPTMHDARWPHIVLPIQSQLQRALAAAAVRPLRT